MIWYLVVGVSLLAPANPAMAGQRDCLSVVRDWRDAVDFQEIENMNYVTWEDGYVQWPGKRKTKWSEVRPMGPPKYDTTLREIRISPVKGNRQLIRLKAITRRVDGNPDTGAYDIFTGDYTVARINYTCERRRGEWKIFSQVVTHHVDLQNKAAAKRYEKLKQP
jgi:hypothetical protein